MDHFTWDEERIGPGRLRRGSDQRRRERLERSLETKSVAAAFLPALGGVYEGREDACAVVEGQPDAWVAGRLGGPLVVGVDGGDFRAVGVGEDCREVGLGPFGADLARVVEQRGQGDRFRGRPGTGAPAPSGLAAGASCPVTWTQIRLPVVNQTAKPNSRVVALPLLDGGNLRAGGGQGLDAELREAGQSRQDKTPFQ